jgi:hypothetical protein
MIAPVRPFRPRANGFNRSHPGSSRTKLDEIARRRQSTPSEEKCYGCTDHRREPWEHRPGCPEWNRKEGCCSGT